MPGLRPLRLTSDRTGYGIVPGTPSTLTISSETDSSPFFDPSSPPDIPFPRAHSPPDEDVSPPSHIRGLAGRASPGFYRMNFAMEAQRRLTWGQTLGAWRMELVSCALGFGIFVCMIIVLRVFDGRGQPVLPIGLTLNSVLQYLTSLAKICFVVPVIEGLGQLKWLWFKSGPRPLSDFQLYEDATRGSFAGAMLLFRLRGLLRWPLLWIAVLLMVSGLFTSALTQQVVTFTVELVPFPDGIATIARATVINRWNGTEYETDPRDQLGIARTILGTSHLEPTDSVLPIAPNCSTADCTWPAFGTMGICAEVVNVTATGDPKMDEQLRNFVRLGLASLNQTSPNFSVGLPPSFVAGGLPLPFSTNQLSPNVTAALTANVLYAYSTRIIDASKMHIEELHLMELALYLCTKTLLTRVEDGAATTRELSSRTAILTPDPESLNAYWNTKSFQREPALSCNVNGSIIQFAPPAGVENTTLSLDTSEEEYQVDLCTMLMASSLYNGYLSGFIALKDTRAVSHTVGRISGALGPALFGKYLGPVPGPEEQLRNMQGLAKNVADGLTNMIRSTGPDFVGGSGTVRGTALGAHAVVKVRWEWLALLASQLVLALAFIAGTVVATRQSGLQILKCSSTATMVVLEPSTRAYLGGIGDMTNLRRRAAKAKVMMETGTSGSGLWFSMVRNRKGRG